MSRAFFITGTGTGIGKTFLTAALCRQLLSKGKKPFAIKPVISGWEENSPENSDTGLLLQNLGLPITAENIAKVSPWRFRAPLSPDMAATREGQQLELSDLAEFCRQAALAHPLLLAEGAGGVMTPLTSYHTHLDLIHLLGWPVVLVCGSYLGALSHTLTASTALQQQHIPIASVVVNATEGSPITVQETSNSLKKFLDSPVFTVERIAENAVMPDITQCLTNL